MPKYLSGPQLAALDGREVVEVLFCEVDFVSGIQRYCTAGAALTASAFDPGSLGLSWQGGADPRVLAPIRETESGEAVGWQITLSGISPSQRALAMAEHIQGRRITLWHGVMDPDTLSLIGTPVVEFEGLLVTMSPVDDESGVMSLVIDAETEEARFLRPNERRYTDRDHQARYPGDTICRFTQQSERNVVWPTAAALRGA